jgi:hypothetical protein
MTFEEFVKYCLIHGIPLDWMEYNIFYLHYLVTRGNEDSIYEWLDLFSSDKQATMLNDQDLFDSSALHRVCYWISGPKALRICQDFVGRGARIQKDIYDRMPWEMDGNFFVNILTGKTIGQRDVATFTDTYDLIKEWARRRVKLNHTEPVSPYSSTPQSVLQISNVILPPLQTKRVRFG